MEVIQVIMTPDQVGGETTKGRLRAPYPFFVVCIEGVINVATKFLSVFGKVFLRALSANMTETPGPL